MAFKFYPEEIAEQGELLLDKLLMIDNYMPVIESRIQRVREAQSIDKPKRHQPKRRAAPRRVK